MRPIASSSQFRVMAADLPVRLNKFATMGGAILTVAAAHCVSGDHLSEE